MAHIVSPMAGDAP